MTRLYRYQGEAAAGGHELRPVNGGDLLVLGGAGPDPDPDPPPYDADLGTVGDRPPVSVKPSMADTGPRHGPTQTMTGAAALAAALAAPVEEDGYRYLRRAHITSTLNLSQASHAGIVFEDCLIEGSSNYVVRAFQSTGTEPDGRWPEFRFCEIRGGSSATIIGGWVRILRCYVHRGVDLFKPGVGGTNGGEIYGSYFNWTWHVPGGHCDIVQIVSRAAGLLIHWNNLAAYDAPDSPAPSSSGYSNAVLQTGTVTGDIGLVSWLDNWLDGGYYTIRGAVTEYDVAYLFRRNKFGGNNSFGAITRLGSSSIDFDASNVYESTGLPVQG